MASPVYSVILNLEGNMNKVLDEAIAKARMLNAELGKTPRNVAPGLIPGRTPRTLPYDDEKSIWRNYRHIPPGWRDKIFQTNNWLGRHNPPFDNKGFLRNVDRSFKNLQQFSNEFLRNSFTLYGIRRNFSNAVNVISSFSRTAGGAVPAIGTAGRIGGAAVIGYGAPALASGLGYWVGMRTLKSQSMQEAAANNMRYNMARHSLGEGYDDAFRAASDIAVSTGSSRVGTLDLISTLTGLNVGGKLLSQEQASYLANITAKLAHASNRDMGVVGLNMQQILTSWQGIDIKELIKSVPLIGKFLQDERRKAGSNEDIYAFVRSNPQAFFRALEEFNKTVKISPVAMARGQIALNRENFFRETEGKFGKVAEKLAAANGELYRKLGEAVDLFLSPENVSKINSIIDNFVSASGKLLEAAGKLAPAATSAVGWTVENPATTTAGIIALFGKGSLQMKVATIVAGSIIDQSKATVNRGKENLIDDTIANPSFRTYLNQFIADSDIPASERKQLFDSILANPKSPKNIGIVTDIANIIKDPSDRATLSRLRRANLDLASEAPTIGIKQIGLAFPGVGIDIAEGVEIGGRNSKNMYVGGGPLGMPISLSSYKTTISAVDKHTQEVVDRTQSIIKQLKNYNTSDDSLESPGASFDTQSAGESDTKKIKGMSGTTRALVINFNREIVSMPTTINANDVADIKQQLEPAIEDMIVRGLTIALNNSTRMI